MDLKDFKPKHVPGLYTFQHYEHESGAFIQVSECIPKEYIVQTAEGDRQHFHSIEGLRAFVATLG